MRLLVVFIMCILPFFKMHAQTNIFNLMEFDADIDPDAVLDELMWKHDANLSDSTSHAYNVFKKKIRIQYIMNSSYKKENEELNYRIRLLMQTNEFDLSYLRQPDHQTSGIMMMPYKSNMKLVIGDFQYDQGLGMLFTTRRRFKSWTQNPHQLLHRPRGLKVNTSSDTSRFLRGGGLRYSWKKVSITGLFSDKNPYENSDQIEAVFLNSNANHIHTGGGIVHVQSITGNYWRYGGHVKLRLPGAIAFAEMAAVKKGGYGLETGLSFFGSDRHRFIILYRLGTPGFFQLFTKIMTNKNTMADKRVLEFNYLWEWKNSWYLQFDVENKESYNLEKRSFSPLNDWIIRIGIKWNPREGDNLTSKIGFDPDGLKCQLRHRKILNQAGAYIQSEIGYSLTSFESSTSRYNSFLGMDMGIKLWKEKISIKSGFCINKGQTGGVLLYRYEPDMFYQMSLPVISGSGIRGYLTCKIKFWDELQLEFKLRRVVYFDRDDSFRNLVKIQMVYRPTFVARSS